MVFPHECCQCGFCCISSTCPVGQLVFSIQKYDPCPALKFRDDVAICQLALHDPETIGVGAGCCIKARAYAGGVEHDFASLPFNIKIQLAQRSREK